MGRDERGLAAMELLRVFAEIHRRPESACGGAGREPAAQRRLHHPLCPQSGATMPVQTGGGVERERERESRAPSFGDDKTLLRQHLLLPSPS